MSEAALAHGRIDGARGWKHALLMTGSGRALIRLTLLAAVLLFWQFVPMDRAVKLWASDPAAIASKLWSWIEDGTLWHNLASTLAVMASGYAIGCAVGAGLGLTLGFYPKLYRVLSPYISAFYALPKIALAPLFIILLGVGYESKIVLVAITVFFLVLNATIDGVRDIDRDAVEALSLMGASNSEVTRKIFLPGAAPWIFTGMRIAVRYAFTNTLLAELIAANSGLGFLIQYNAATFDSSGVYAAILILVVFSVALTEVLSRIEKRASRR